MAVVGGEFYHGTAFPAQYRNAYFFADYNVGMVWSMVTDGQSVNVQDFASGFTGVVQITSGPDGSLYVLSIRAGMPSVYSLYWVNRLLSVAFACSHHDIFCLNPQYGHGGRPDRA